MDNFVTDLSKMLDFVSISKKDFLDKYDKISEQEYNNTLELYKQNYKKEV